MKIIFFFFRIVESYGKKNRGMSDSLARKNVLSKEKFRGKAHLMVLNLVFVDRWRCNISTRRSPIKLRPDTYLQSTKLITFYIFLGQ